MLLPVFSYNYLEVRLFQGEQWRQSRQNHKQCHGGASWLSLVSYLLSLKTVAHYTYIPFRRLSYPAYSRLLLQLWQHDDLPHLLHEVNTLSSVSQPESLNIFRQHGSPDLTYADFIVVQSVWGMTQGLIMPLSGYISRCHLTHDVTSFLQANISRWTGPRAAMLLGCLIFSLGAAATR